MVIAAGLPVQFCVVVQGHPTTMPAASRRSMAIRLAATVWMSSAGTTRGLAISSKTPARERTVNPIVRPTSPSRGVASPDLRRVEARAGEGRRDRDVDALGKAQPDGACGALEQELGRGRFSGAEVDEDVQALGGPPASAVAMPSKAASAPGAMRRACPVVAAMRRTLALEDGIGEGNRAHRPDLTTLERCRNQGAENGEDRPSR